MGNWCLFSPPLSEAQPAAGAELTLPHSSSKSGACSRHKSDKKYTRKSTRRPWRQLAELAHTLHKRPSFPEHLQRQHFALIGKSTCPTSLVRVIPDAPHIMNNVQPSSRTNHRSRRTQKSQVPRKMQFAVLPYLAVPPEGNSSSRRAGIENSDPEVFLAL
jgi:hypothetical protein